MDGGRGGGKDKVAGGTSWSRLVGWAVALEQDRGDGWEGNREGGGPGGWRGWGVAGQGGWRDRTAGGTAWSRLVGWALALEQDRGDGWEGDREGRGTGWLEGMGGCRTVRMGRHDGWRNSVKQVGWVGVSTGAG